LLLERQHEDGSWGSDSVFGEDANYRSAITVLCLQALEAAGKNEEAAKAVERGVRFVDANAHRRPAAASYGMYDFSFYSASYALAYFARQKKAGRLGASESIERCLKTLERTQREDGGFTYLFSPSRGTYESFATALVVINALEASALGVEVPGRIKERALEALRKSRTPEGYFCYHVVDGKQRGSLSGNGKLNVEGSLVRTVVCEYALVRAGEGGREKLDAAVAAFFEHRELLEQVRKRDQKTHQGPFDNAPYYFQFGHLYAALALRELGGERRAERERELENVVMRTREEDGSWTDGRVTGRDYGIATALLILARVRPLEY
jgi:uncharacterized protein YfaS (alpha-2-macroglobulin family)